MGLAGAAAAALSAMFEGISEDDGLWPELVLPFEPSTGLPELFQQAERVHEERKEDGVEAFLDLREDFPGIADAVIVRDPEVGESLYKVADRNL